jgi:isobutyryl-CoA mutase
MDKFWHGTPLRGVRPDLADLVEEAVLAEFEAISARGGVLGAMETGYQRGKIQDEPMLYEQRKHDGFCPSSASTPSGTRRATPRPVRSSSPVAPRKRRRRS